MARKDLLKGLLTPSATPPALSAQPRVTKGAIGAVSQSIADLRNRSVIEVPVDMIDHAGLRDRLDEDPDGIALLAESMRDYGQQVPVLLRHSLNIEGRYEIVYGRRRVAAMKLLNQPVKAMVRELNDRDLIVAQGQENTARKDLSFIEKANFARHMRDSGFDRKVICDALQIDKTLISRMLSIADAIPPALLTAIGAAPGIGRDRWLTLANRIKDQEVQPLVAAAKGDASDARFEAVLAHVSTPPKPAKRPVLAGADGAPLGDVLRGAKTTTLNIARDKADGFDDWLVANMDRIHRDWLSSRGE
ncbi:plasmid partitioning protein RepB [Falsirhodobacter sp. 20TX0035]|uniref:plasmid partitioning protein RepB n=1 Tax=Falsirhodobacter sp. 20TX0035 TaxID=3022019 RepID=UPI00232CA81A|nr:plasmid partitioning protein RepB [Falsirhodobacter sp. 20TX0035]MDB6454559.1 plasmid partitioning protein RepB [Falsirhodobacter sp. 20TX0035]